MSALDRGRQSFAGQAWGEAYAQLSVSDQDCPLLPEDLERLATVAFLLGKDVESADLWARAHQELISRGDAARAARCAFWLAFGLRKSESAKASGWLARARRLLDDGREECVEHGYLLFPVALQRIFAGDDAGAYDSFGQVVAIGDRYGDRDLVTLARHGQGRALIRLGRTGEGIALLDEVMVAVTTGEVSPIVVGDVYCGVIEACHEIFDLRRAQEWTDALSGWCASQPDLVPFRGQCLVRRAEIMQLHGAWPDAMKQAQRACEQLLEHGESAVGAAFYQQAELHRLRGHFAKADESYRQASQWGRKPQPGLAQLRLAQGQTDVAEASIRRALDETKDRPTRARILAAFVEIMLAAGDAEAAHAASDELSTIATDLHSPFLAALSARTAGAVILAEGQPQAALLLLRHAWTGWRQLEAPYESARVRVLVGLACRTLGDNDTAEMELDAASQVFQQLGAAADLAQVKALSRLPAARPAGRLTAREVQVLRLVATGRTNRAIAGDLVISEKTVARHVSNILTKLGLSSRAGATAYAYENDLT